MSEPLSISDEELLEIVKAEAQERMGMKWGEFHRAFTEHRLPDTLAGNELSMLMKLLGYEGGMEGYYNGGTEETGAREEMR